LAATFEKLSPDSHEYVSVWTAVLKYVLLYDEDRIVGWMESYGLPLLLVEKSNAFHEEPWYWVCSTVAGSLAKEGAGPHDITDLERKIFWILHSAIHRQDLNAVDWASVRERCIRAVR